jgi:hypothetical protein
MAVGVGANGNPASGLADIIRHKPNALRPVIPKGNKLCSVTNAMPVNGAGTKPRFRPIITENAIA